MSQNPSYTDNQVKHIDEKFLSGVRTYETSERGMMLILGEGLPPAVFGDNPGNHHFCVLDMEHERRGISPEIQRKMAMKLETTKPFIKGRVKYVPSAEEVLAAEKRKEQAETLKKYQNTLKEGLFVLALEGKTPEQLVSFADEIGAVHQDIKGSRLRKDLLIKNINDLLGINTEPAPEPAPAETDTQAKQKRK